MKNTKFIGLVFTLLLVLAGCTETERALTPTEIDGLVTAVMQDSTSPESLIAKSTDYSRLINQYHQSGKQSSAVAVYARLAERAISSDNQSLIDTVILMRPSVEPAFILIVSGLAYDSEEAMQRELQESNLGTFSDKGIISGPQGVGLFHFPDFLRSQNRGRSESIDAYIPNSTSIPLLLTGPLTDSYSVYRKHVMKLAGQQLTAEEAVNSSLAEIEKAYIQNYYQVLVEICFNPELQLLRNDTSLGEPTVNECMANVKDTYSTRFSDFGFSLPNVSLQALDEMALPSSCRKPDTNALVYKYKMAQNYMRIFRLYLESSDYSDKRIERNEKSVRDRMYRELC